MFYDEYIIGMWVQCGMGQEWLLSCWDQFVCINVEYGLSVSDEICIQDMVMICEYVG